MFFRHLQLYRLPAGVELALDQLSRKTFQPCGSQDAQSRGWVSPTGDGQLVHQVGSELLLCMQAETRLLPSDVIKAEVEQRATHLAEQQGFKPGRKQLKELKECVIQELLPRAFTRQKKTYLWIDPTSGWLGVDAPSQARAEDVLELLRQSLDVLPLSVVRTALSPANVMADWLAAGEATHGFNLEEEFALESVSESKAKAVFTHHDTEAAHVTEHLAAGKLPTKLALTFDERVSFVLTEKLELKRLDFLDVVKENLDQTNAEDAHALFDAGFALMAGELQSLIWSLVQALGGELTPLTEEEF